VVAPEPPAFDLFGIVSAFQSIGAGVLLPRMELFVAAGSGRLDMRIHAYVWMTAQLSDKLPSVGRQNACRGPIIRSSGSMEFEQYRNVMREAVGADQNKVGQILLALQ